MSTSVDIRSANAAMPMSSLSQAPAIPAPLGTVRDRPGTGRSLSSRPDPRPVAVISGITSGIGRLTAERLIERGYRVIGLVRSASRAAPVLAALPAAASAPGPWTAARGSLELVLCDLGSLRSVRRTATLILTRTRRIDLLVNNAGGLEPRSAITDEGVETTVASNFLGAAELTLCLLPALRAAGSARVVNLASAAHAYAGAPAWTDFNQSVPRRRLGAYAWAKLAVVVFTRALARRVASDGIAVYALHPGVLRTGFGRTTGGWLQWLIAVARPFLRPASDGADALAWLATAGTVPAPSGSYFVGRTPRLPSAAARDDQGADRLWDLTISTLACVTPPDADRAVA